MKRYDYIDIVRGIGRAFLRLKNQSPKLKNIPYVTTAPQVVLYLAK